MELACGFGPSSGVILLVGLLQYLWLLRELPGGDGAVCHRYFCWLRPPPPLILLFHVFQLVFLPTWCVVYALSTSSQGVLPRPYSAVAVVGITDVTPVLGSSPWVTFLPA